MSTSRTTPSQTSSRAHNFRRRWQLLAAVGGILWTGSLALGSTEPSPRELTIRACVEEALTRNRTLQVERFNPEIARSLLSSSYGYYDPVLNLSYEWEDTSDTGGFDPADFSRDAVYEADSDVATTGLTGFLPTGLSYSAGGNYAHSDGTRNSLLFDSYKVMAGISVRQPLLKNFWTDAGRTTIRINRANLKITELALTYAVMDIVRQVYQAYYELAFARAELEVNRRLLQARDATRAGIQRQAQVGTMTVLDERLAESQMARTEVGVITASNQVALAENALKSLLGWEEPEWVNPIVPIEPSIALPESFELSQSWRRALTSRPDLARMRQEEQRADVDLRFRHNQLFPSVDVVAEYGRRGANASQTLPPTPPTASLSTALDQIRDADAPNTVVGVVFSMPLSRARERANYQAGKQLKQQAAARVKQQEDLVLREVSDSLATAQSAYAALEAGRRARETAAAALQAEELKLRQGKSSLFIVLQLQGDLAAAESIEIRTRADYLQALAQLRFAEGSLLDHAQVKLDFD